MKPRSTFLHLVAFFLTTALGFCAAQKPRIVVLTDIENEPDDAMSMVRFLTYANHFDIEGLVATTSIHQRKRVAPQRIRRIVEAYGKVRANLEKHEPGFPTGAHLLSLVTEGLPVYGMEGVGEGKDSPGSELLIRALDRADPRPLWVPVWGGPSVLAQALWKIRATRSPDALAKAVAQLRAYTISDQDDSGPWLRKEFPHLFYITSPGFSAGGAYHHATWSGISGDYFHARCAGADFSLVTNEWGVDGRWHDTNHATIWRWRPAYQNDFAARMDWTVKPYKEANHPPVPKLGHPATLTAKPGQRVELSAEGTTDPDGDAVSYEWFYYDEAGTFATSNSRSGQPLEIKNFDQPKAWFTVPSSRVMAPGTGTMHVILAVTDHGTPRLTRYQRVIVTVQP